LTNTGVPALLPVKSATAESFGFPHTAVEFCRVEPREKRIGAGVQLLPQQGGTGPAQEYNFSWESNECPDREAKNGAGV